MKKAFKIIGIILLVFIVAVGVLAVWQRGNLTSIITSTKYSKEEIAEKINDNKKKTDEMIKSYSDSTIRDLSHEEEEKIRCGEITAEEVISKILSESTANASKVVDFADSAKGNTELVDSSVDLNAVINEHVTRMYTLKAIYIGKLGDLERRATNDYKALPKAKRGSGGQQTIISKYIGEAAGLESECDNAVNQVLDSLQKGLKSNNGDLELIKTMRKSYEEEKVLKKSYYLNTYNTNSSHN